MLLTAYRAGVVLALAVSLVAVALRHRARNLPRIFSSALRGLMLIKAIHSRSIHRQNLE